MKTYNDLEYLRLSRGEKFLYRLSTFFLSIPTALKNFILGIGRFFKNVFAAIGREFADVFTTFKTVTGRRSFRIS